MRMNPLGSLMKMNWSSSKMRALDYGLAVATMILGLATGSQWVFWIGVAGVALAFLNPMGRLQGGVRGFIKPKD